MKKELIRKEFFKLKLKGHSYNQCRKILSIKYNYEITNRTLKRWMSRLDNEDEWDLRDKSRKPKIIHYKINSKIEKKVIELRNKTGYGANKIACFVKEISDTSIRRILEKKKLTNHPKRKKKRNKYIRWERKHPNSLWQIDHSDQKVDGKWVVSVIDDCSRKSLAFVPVNRVTTNVVIKILDDLIKIYGKPKQILSDNGSAYGLKSKHSKFDRKLKRRGIEHIRSAVHSPTTCGKVERLFQTFKQEFKFCNNDLDLFRMRYNHFRPHTSLNNKTPDEIYNDFSLLF
ncbi:MAG: DDE-type integrase/transposase/recombinase [Nanoarchaeota archaeon]|nr:DDE-type integrase/transposase/recombinase [Nanoarchaeota archaeon]